MTQNRKIRIVALVLIIVTVLSVSALAMAKTLKKGDRGTVVKKLQNALVNCGYDCNTNGLYTERTVKAVKSYQKKWGKTATGTATDGMQAGLLGGAYSYGSYGPMVKEFQAKLKKAGYKLVVDGDYGKSTVTAVKSFQKAKGLKVDGVAGTATQKALENGGSGKKDTNVLKYGDSGKKVIALQKALKKMNCFSSTIDGDFGTLTETAVKKYQKKVGLEVDGIAGPETISELEEDSGITIFGSEFPLTIGSKGAKVRAVTAFLREKGYVTTTTSSYTKYISNKVRVWQSETGKEETGEITEYQYKRIISGKED